MAGQDARPTGSSSPVFTAAGSPTPSSPLFPDRSLTGVFGSSGPCSSEGLTAEDMLERRRVCRIFGRGICRALGAEHIRHGRAASKEVLTRRRLSLDYVLEHPGLPRQSARVRADRGVHMRHRGAVAPRPPERRCRSGASGRGRERPPLSGCLDLHPGGLACARPCQPSAGGRSRSISPCGKTVELLTRTASRIWAGVAVGEATVTASASASASASPTASSAPSPLAFGAEASARSSGSARPGS